MSSRLPVLSALFFRSASWNGVQADTSNLGCSLENVFRRFWDDYARIGHWVARWECYSDRVPVWFASHPGYWIGDPAVSAFPGGLRYSRSSSPSEEVFTTDPSHPDLSSRVSPEGITRSQVQAQGTRRAVPSVPHDDRLRNSFIESLTDERRSQCMASVSPRIKTDRTEVPQRRRDLAPDREQVDRVKTHSFRGRGQRFQIGAAAKRGEDVPVATIAGQGQRSQLCARVGAQLISSRAELLEREQTRFVDEHSVKNAHTTRRKPTVRAGQLWRTSTVMLLLCTIVPGIHGTAPHHPRGPPKSLPRPRPLLRKDSATSSAANVGRPP